MPQQPLEPEPPSPPGSVDAVREAKRALRHELKARLASMPPAEAGRASQTAVERLLARPEVQRARSVLTCLSFGGEVDTWPLVDRLLAAGVQVSVPRATAGDEDLHLHPYPCALETLSFGLRQPLPVGPEVDPDTLDLAVVLGLGFDRRGFRLGYGRGYFDRLLAGRRFPTVGLCFDQQLVDRLPVADHDVPLSLVVTDRETVRKEGGRG